MGCISGCQNRYMQFIISSTIQFRNTSSLYFMKTWNVPEHQVQFHLVEKNSGKCTGTQPNTQLHNIWSWCILSRNFFPFSLMMQCIRVWYICCIKIWNSSSLLLGISKQPVMSRTDACVVISTAPRLFCSSGNYTSIATVKPSSRVLHTYIQLLRGFSVHQGTTSANKNNTLINLTTITV